MTFISHDGALLANDCSVIRLNYFRHHRHIRSTLDLRATLRAGNFTDLGGYPIYLIGSDGAVYAPETVRRNYRQAVEDWHIVACEVNYEDEIYDDHTGDLIPSAYGSDEEEESK